MILINRTRLKIWKYQSDKQSGVIRGFEWKLLKKAKLPNGRIRYTFQMTENGLTSTPRTMISTRDNNEKVADIFIHEMTWTRQLKK